MSTATTAAAPAPTAVRDLPPVHRPRRPATRFVLPVYSILMIVYLTSPVFLMILYSFNDVPRERQTVRFWGPTLDWWKNLFDVPGLTAALQHSITIAIPSTVVATILGTLLGLALGRYGFRGRGLTNFVIFLAIAVPEVVLGSSLLSLFVTTRAVPLGYGAILLSHISFSVPFVAVIVRARVQGMDRSLEDAAQDLFASPVTAFFKVTLPLIMPGVLAGGLLAFVLSLDDFVITNFVSGTFETFPVWVYGATKIGLPPQVNVLSTILFVTGLALAVLNVAVQRRRT
ncbi:MAG TPA: ABC transporter permease [Actinomycetota bacterium]|nr:ABC transporter permease [Actinomycetota bacterium]